METFSAFLPRCEGNPPVTSGFPSQRPVTPNLDVLICTWMNGWVNNREADDLRRYHAPYDVLWIQYNNWFLNETKICKYAARVSIMSVDGLATSGIRLSASISLTWYEHIPWLRHQMETFKFRVTGPLCGEFTGPGEFPAQRPVTRSFDVFFDLRLNKRLSKQPWGWWFETPS